MRALLVGQATEVSSAITWKRFADWMGNKSGWRKQQSLADWTEEKSQRKEQAPISEQQESLSRHFAPVPCEFPACVPPASCL